jgi:hypothetical protein
MDEWTKNFMVRPQHRHHFLWLCRLGEGRETAQVAKNDSYGAPVTL